MDTAHDYATEDANLSKSSDALIRSIQEIERLLGEIKEGATSVIFHTRLLALTIVALAVCRLDASHENIKAQAALNKARSETLGLIQEKLGGDSELASAVNACDQKVLRCMGEDFAREHKNCAQVQDPVKCIGDAANNFFDDSRFERCATGDNKGKACYDDLATSVKAMK